MCRPSAGDHVHFLQLQTFAQFDAGPQVTDMYRVKGATKNADRVQNLPGAFWFTLGLTMPSLIRPVLFTDVTIAEHNIFLAG